MKPRTLISLVAVALFLGLAGPGPAQAAKQPGITAINISPQIASDDDRYVAFQRRNGVPVVLDTWRGTFRALRGANYCQPRDIGGGRVLLICPHKERRWDTDSGFRARTGSVLGGRTKPLVKSRQLADAYEIGRFWLRVEFDFRHAGQPPVYEFLNWRNGRTKYVDPAPYYERGGVDLSSRRLGWARVKLFAPRIDGRRLGWEHDICRSADVVVAAWKRQVYLWREPSTPVRLGPLRSFGYGCDWVGPLRIGTDWMTWSNGPIVQAYNFRTGEKFKRRYGKAALITPFRDGFVVARKVRKFARYYTAFRVEVIRP